MDAFDFGRALRRLRMRHFELLSLLGSEQTVRAAARAMSLTQPAVSKMLREVEESFGQTLFERSHSGVSPTPAGALLVGRAQAFLNELRFTGEDVHLLSGGMAASLRIGTYSVIPRVPLAMARLRTQRPGVVLRVREAPAHVLLDALIDGELDCVVCAMPHELLENRDAGTLHVHPLDDDVLCVVAAPSHALARRRALGWGDVMPANWVLPPQDSILRLALIDVCLRRGLVPPTPVIEVMSPVLLVESLALDPRLLGLARREQTEVEVRDRRLVRIAVAPEEAIPPIAFITRRRATAKAELLAAFRDALAEGVRPPARPGIARRHR